MELEYPNVVKIALFDELPSEPGDIGVRRQLWGGATITFADGKTKAEVLAALADRIRGLEEDRAL